MTVQAVPANIGAAAANFRSRLTSRRLRLAAQLAK